MNNSRLAIINELEQEKLYSLPVMGPDERDFFFTLSKEEDHACSKLATCAFQKAHFILLLGYFKVRKIKFSPSWGQIKDDLDYIYDRYFTKPSRYRRNLDDRTRRKIYRSIYKLQSYSGFTLAWRNQLKNHLDKSAQKFMNKRHLLDECLYFLDQFQVEIPAYSTLQKLITQVIDRLETNFECVLQRQLSQSEINNIKLLLIKEESQYGFTVLKRFVKDFSFSETGKAIEQNKTLKSLYSVSSRIVSESGLSISNIEHFGKLATYYTVNQLKQFPVMKSAIYLLCYIYFQNQKINDLLVQSFDKLVRKFQNQASNYKKERQHEEAAIVAKKLKNMAPILDLFSDNTVHENTPFSSIKKMAFGFISKRDMPVISRYIAGLTLDKNNYVWDYYDSKMGAITRNMRRLFLAIDFEVHTDYPLLSDQILKAKAVFSSGAVNNNFSLDKRLIEKNQLDYLHPSNDSNASQSKRCEWYLYQKIDKLLESSTVFVRNSHKYKPFDDYLAPKNTVPINVVVPQTFDAAGGHIKDLQNQLASKLADTGIRIVSNDNTHVSLNNEATQLKWKRAYKANHTDMESPFLKATQPESIIKLMRWVSKQTGISKLFKHMQNQNQDDSFNIDNVLACLIANGTDAGVLRFSRTSDRSHHQLLQTQADYLTLDSLEAVNSCLQNTISCLPIYESYKYNDQIHASIDGQKYETRMRQILARYSPKYFGMQPGISVMTLVAGHLPINSKIISANEHESHHIYDLLFNQPTEIKPDIVSVDQHGVNAFNFAIMNAFGYQFAPRFAKMKNRFENHFKLVPGAAPENLLEVRKSINWNLILEEWENIIQIFTSLEQKNATQEFLVKKLCSYKKYSNTLKALNEYDRALRLIYMLDYVDDESMRRNVQSALNIGESFHQMQRAIASVNGGDTIRGRNEAELVLWNESSKFIANCILYYNTYILSHLLKHYRDEGNLEGIERVTHASPVAWAHITMSGFYNCSSSNDDAYEVNRVIEELKMIA